MKQILIVDDEKYFRKALIVSTDWENLGYCVCGEAGNGIEALEKVQSLKPDVVVTDINMSKMDGLTFISSLQKIKPDIKLIVISGYNEFDYVKRSLVLGVCNYITKPVDFDEFSRTLTVVSAAIDKERTIRHRIDNLRLSLDTSIRLLRNQVLTKLLHGSLPTDATALKQMLDKYQIKLKEGPFTVIVMEVTEWQSSIWSEEDQNLWLYAVENISSELLLETYICEVFAAEQGRIYAILQCPISGSSNLTDTLVSLQAILWEQLGLRIWIGVGTPHHSLRSIHASGKEAVYAIAHQSLSTAKNTILFYKDVKANDLPTQKSPIYSKQQLLMQMRQGNVDACIAQLQSAEQRLLVSRAGLPTIHMSLIEILSAFFSFASENADCLSDTFSGVYSEFLVELANSQDPHKDFLRAEEILRTLLSDVHSNHKPKPSSIVTKVLDIIHQEYADSTLTVERLAQETFTSYGYLCYLFKRDMNKTLNDYITDYRMEQARFLLLRGNCTINEVAEQVGFSNPNYFSKIFKKKFGVLPSNFRLNS